MSERIYRWLLRLYPAQFRAAYGDAALQLFRDRLRDERGFFPSLQLWLDLITDLVVSVPREHRCARQALVGAIGRPLSDGTPTFRVLADGSPRWGALLFGAMLSLVTLGVVPSSVTHFGNPMVVLAASSNSSLDTTEKHLVIEGAAANLKQYYVDRGVGATTADALLSDEKRGDYNAVRDGAAFAELLTMRLRNTSSDMHLEVIYSRQPLPNRPPGPTPEGAARYRKAMQQSNCTFERVEILPHNIGYLKLNSFPDPSICGATATAAMASVNHADAVIFDLRDNGGGFPDMVMLIAAYLFDHPEYMYNPRENTTEKSWTRSPVPGSRLADKPVYVLTSASTISGAEHFSYDLKMLKRATLVGETTRGAAHSGVFHRIDEHFGMALPETKAINPFSTPDWAATGVEPDVKVKAADALTTAQKLADNKLAKK